MKTFIKVFNVNETQRDGPNPLFRRTDQPKKKALFSRFAAVHPLREIIFFAEKNKNHLFRRRLSPQIFAKKLRESSRRNSARFREETPRNFAMGREGPKDSTCGQRGL